MAKGMDKKKDTKGKPKKSIKEKKAAKKEKKKKQEVFDMKKVIFTNVDYIGNVGDYWASPTHYYDFPFDYKRVNFVDVCNKVRENPNWDDVKDSNVVIGGGGLIITKNNYLQKGLQNLIDNNKCYLWGIGSNTTVSDERFSWDFLNNKNIIMKGLRDTVHGLNCNYIPCVSVKHKIFDNYINTSPKGSGFGILEHVDINIPIEGVDKIKNNEKIENIINFIFNLYSSVEIAQVSPQ